MRNYIEDITAIKPTPLPPTSKYLPLFIYLFTQGPLDLFTQLTLGIFLSRNFILNYIIIEIFKYYISNYF